MGRCRIRAARQGDIARALALAIVFLDGCGGAAAQRDGAVPLVDVRATGAVGDGLTDDTDAIQRAVDSAAGGTVLVPAGIYLVRVSDGMEPTGIALSSNLIFQMAAGAVLQAIPTASEKSSVLRVWNARQVRIAGGILVGERAGHLGVGGEHGFGIELRGSSDVIVDGVTARDFWGDGFYVGTTKEGSGCHDIQVRRATALHNRRQGLSIVDCSGAVVDDCTFAGAGGTAPGGGVDLEPNLGTVVESVQITNCRMTGNQLGILLAGGGAAAGKNRKNRVAGNTVSESAINGISLVAVDDAIVENNVVGGSGAAGIQLYRTTHSQVAWNAVTKSALDGIQVLASSWNTLADNSVTASSQAVNASHDGISLANGSSENAIKNNRCRTGDGPALARYGIRIATADCSANVVSHNDLLMSGQPGGLSDDGTGTIVE